MAHPYRDRLCWTCGHRPPLEPAILCRECQRVLIARVAADLQAAVRSAGIDAETFAETVKHLPG